MTTPQTTLRSWKKLGHQATRLGLIAAITVAFAAPAVPAQAQNTKHISSQPVGSVVKQSNLKLPEALQPLAKGKRIAYVSTDQQGQKIIVSGMVITPHKQAPGANIVAWAHGTTGVGDKCAPSTNPDVFWPEAVDAMKEYLERGWTVAATDYPGLGTPGAHPYLMGDSQARAVIDSVRAARDLDHKLGNDWVATGHSQGGQAALFAGEIADTYGQGLDLKAVVGIAPASNLDLIAATIPGTPQQGYIVIALSGLAAVDPSIQLDQILAQPALDRLPVLESGCLYEIFESYGSLTADELLIGGELSAEVLAKFAAQGSPAQQASTAPVLLAQGTADQTIPAELTGLLHSQVCAYGTASYLQLFPGATHDSIPTVSAEYVATYLQARFAGESAPSNC